MNHAIVFFFSKKKKKTPTLDMILGTDEPVTQTTPEKLPDLRRTQRLKTLY